MSSAVTGSIRPGHAVLNGKCPGSGILGSISCQKRMIFALGVLINQRQFGYTAGKHIEVILAEHSGFDGSRRADGQRINGVGGCRFRGLRGGSLGAWLGGGCLSGFCRGSCRRLPEAAPSAPPAKGIPLSFISCISPSDWSIYSQIHRFDHKVSSPALHRG